AGQDGSFITMGTLPQVPPFPASRVAPAAGARVSVASYAVFGHQLADMTQISPLECMVSEVHVRSVKILARLELSGLSRSPLFFFCGLHPLVLLAAVALFNLG